MAYAHKNKKGQTYFLHRTEVVLRGSGKKQTIYFFARDVRKNSLEEVPAGYKVVENKKTGLPVLKKS